MDELAKVTEYFRKLGASAGQADVMARQLLKRAGQLAVERKQSREEALAYLLQLMMQAQTGKVTAESPPGTPRPNT